jgi:hypothetical protein
MLQVLYESLSLLIALIAGIYSYQCMNLFLRTLFFQLISWVVFYILSYIITIYQRLHGLELDNQWIFNIAIAVEASFLTLAAYRYFLDDKRRFLSLALYGLFIIVLVSEIFFSSWKFLASYAVSISGILVSMLYILILYRNFKEHSSWKDKPEIWASLGLVIYFAGLVPYFAMFKYLNEYQLKISNFLIHIITDVLANIRYISLALAFWLARRNFILINK